MMQVRKTIEKTVLVLCLLAVVFMVGCSKEEAEAPPVIRPVKVIEIGDLEKGVSRAFPGKVIANTTADLAFRVPGQIKVWPIKEGQELKEGELVAQLDQRDYKAALDRAQAQYSGAVASRKEAEANYKRGEQLLPSGAIARATFDEMMAAYENAKAKEASIAQEIRTARLNLEYTTLKAPFDGVVSAKYVSNHENVQAQQPVIKFQDIDSIDIVVEVPEFIWGRINKAREAGEKGAESVLAYFDAYPDRGYEVTLKEFQTAANPETQTYSVRLTMPQPVDFKAFPGMSAKVEADLKFVGVEGFTVPVQAVFGGNDGTKYLWVVGDDMLVKKIPVQTGEMAGGSISIAQGLKGGEKVVVAGVNSLQPDMRVTILGDKAEKE